MFNEKSDLTLTQVFIERNNIFGRWFRGVFSHVPWAIEDATNFTFFMEPEEIASYETYGYGYYCDRCGCTLSMINEGSHGMCEKCRDITHASIKGLDFFEISEKTLKNIDF